MIDDELKQYIDPTRADVLTYTNEVAVSSEVFLTFSVPDIQVIILLLNTERAETIRFRLLRERVYALSVFGVPMTPMNRL